MTQHHHRDVDTTYQADGPSNAMSFSIEQSDMKEYFYQKYQQYKDSNEHLTDLTIDDDSGFGLTNEEEKAIIAKKKAAAASGESGDDDVVIQKKLAAADEDDAVIQKKLAAADEDDAVVQKKLASQDASFDTDAVIAKKNAHANAVVAYKTAQVIFDKMYT